MQNAIDSTYQDLANAIVLQAVEDYRNALDGIGYDGYPPEHLVKDLEKFFRSYYFQVLTKVDGKFLIEKLKEEHRAKVERRKNERNIDSSNT